MFDRKQLAVAIAATVCSLPMLASAAEVSARSDMQLYGRAHLSVDMLKDGGDYSEMSVSSNSSRLGFKGTTDFGDLTGLFQIEQEINFSESGNDWASRDTFAGVRGDFGMLRIGKFDTPFKAARGPANLFGDQVGDMRNLTRVGNARFDERAPNVIHYQSPRMGAMQFNLAYSHHEGAFKEDDAKDTAMSTSLTYREGPLDLALAYEAFGEDASRGKRSAVRLAAGFKVMDDLKLVGFYQSADHDDDAHDADVFGAGVNYTITPRKTYLNAHYLMRSADADDSDSQMFALGVEHRVHSELRFYANYAQVANDDNAALTPWGQARTATPSGAAGETASAISIGMRYDF